MTKPTFLDFEKAVADLESKIQELQFTQADGAVDISEEIQKLREKADIQIKELYAQLSSWQISQVARHPQRPYTLDYIEKAFTDFKELHGDRGFADDPAIVGGLARLDGRSVMVIGHQKGRDLKERTYRNFGMPRPEGYRKAERLMKLAERFSLPVITLIDTPGAYPGIGAEERGQSEAIGRNLFVMAGLRVPIVAAVIGEGGSGGALAIAVADHLVMMQYATYSVISPEGCASILWKRADKAADAAEALGVTAPKLKSLGLVDKVVNEPLGGAHRSPSKAADALKKALLDGLAQVEGLDADALVARRQQRVRAYGRVKQPAVKA